MLHPAITLSLHMLSACMSVILHAPANLRTPCAIGNLQATPGPSTRRRRNGRVQVQTAHHSHSWLVLCQADVWRSYETASCFGQSVYLRGGWRGPGVTSFSPHLSAIHLYLSPGSRHATPASRRQRVLVPCGDDGLEQVHASCWFLS